MFWFLAAASLILWVVGMVIGLTSGGLIHLLLLCAVVSLVTQFSRPSGHKLSEPSP
jgi:hypothetical protein